MDTPNFNLGLEEEYKECVYVHAHACSQKALKLRSSCLYSLLLIIMQVATCSHHVSCETFAPIDTLKFAVHPFLSRVYRPAKGGERACNSRTSCIEGEMLAVTKLKSRNDAV